MFSILLAALLALAPVPALSMRAPSAAPPGTVVVEHKVYGTVVSLSGSTLVIRTRFGRLVMVDGRRAHSAVLLRPNRPVIVYGGTDTRGVMHARAIWRTFPDSAHWPADR
jgi:hypothetical protein